MVSIYYQAANCERMESTDLYPDNNDDIVLCWFQRFFRFGAGLNLITNNLQPV